MTSPALSQGIPCLILLRESPEPLPPPHPRRRQRPSSSGVDWLLEAKPETPEPAMLNGIRCTDSRPPSREAAPTSRTAHSTRVPSYLPRRERPTARHPCCVHTLMWHKQAAGSGTFRRHLLRLRPSRARPSQLHISRRRASAWASPSVTIGNPPNCPPPSSSHDPGGCGASKAPLRRSLRIGDSHAQLPPP